MRIQAQQDRCTFQHLMTYFIDATTINTAGAGTVQTRLAYNGSGFTDLATNIFPPKTTLPITLISFTATKQGSNALIQWSTETEINSNYVDVERSTNATDFDKVGSVTASGNTSTVQNYINSLINKWFVWNSYYRLKVDIDGQVNYSKLLRSILMALRFRQTSQFIQTRSYLVLK